MAAHALKKRKLEHFAKDVEEIDHELLRADDSNASVEFSERRQNQNGAGEEEGENRPAGNSNSRHSKKHSATDQGSPYGWADYNTNMFKLQAEEMLMKVRPTHKKRMVKVDAALRKLKEIIEILPDQDPLTVAEAQKGLIKKHAIRIPFPEPPPEQDAKYTLSYSKPASINVVGSYARNTLIQFEDQLSIDLAVTMPAKIFQEKDYLNYRYFHKRAYYLAQIAVGINESKDIDFHIDYAYQNDNHLQPIIVLQPGGNGGDFDFSRSKCQIRILLAASGDTFPTAKTQPDKKCIGTRSDENASRIAQGTPTPLYNASLRSECCSFKLFEVVTRHFVTIGGLQ